MATPPVNDPLNPEGSGRSGAGAFGTCLAAPAPPEDVETLASPMVLLASPTTPTQNIPANPARRGSHSTNSELSISSSTHEPYSLTFRNLAAFTNAPQQADLHSSGSTSGFIRIAVPHYSQDSSVDADAASYFANANMTELCRVRRRSRKGSLGTAPSEGTGETRSPTTRQDSLSVSGDGTAQSVAASGGGCDNDASLRTLSPQREPFTRGGTSPHRRPVQFHGHELEHRRISGASNSSAEGCGIVYMHKVSVATRMQQDLPPPVVPVVESPPLSSRHTSPQHSGASSPRNASPNLLQNTLTPSSTATLAPLGLPGSTPYNVSTSTEGSLRRPVDIQAVAAAARANAAQQLQLAPSHGAGGRRGGAGGHHSSAMPPEAAPPEAMCPKGWEVELFDATNSATFAAPSHLVVAADASVRYFEAFNRNLECGEPLPQFVRCKKYVEGTCAAGVHCSCVHTLAMPSASIHVNASKLPPHLRCHIADFETLPEGVRFFVYPSNSTTTWQEVPSEKVLKTDGAQNAFCVLKASQEQARAVGDTAALRVNRTPLRPRHCAHFQSKRVCYLGAACNFVHSTVPAVDMSKPPPPLPPMAGGPPAAGLRMLPVSGGPPGPIVVGQFGAVSGGYVGAQSPLPPPPPLSATGAGAFAAPFVMGAPDLRQPPPLYYADNVGAGHLQQPQSQPPSGAVRFASNGQQLVFATLPPPQQQQYQTAAAAAPYGTASQHGASGGSGSYPHYYR